MGPHHTVMATRPCMAVFDVPNLAEDPTRGVKELARRRSAGTGIRPLIVDGHPSAGLEEGEVDGADSRPHVEHRRALNSPPWCCIPWPRRRSAW